ncbi:Lactonase, 7-bladed beta-propeller-domain-containing protein [Coniochaeta sp. 2T2.1]|nr:Lactonase, 7-bladed beta-propeller-domain-containing protein [Coniochaeta sp. 2T2.1]
MSIRSLLQAGASTLVGLALLPTASSATLLYVASYSGTVTTLNLTATTSGSPSLQSVASSPGCGPNPSWLTLDKATSTLYCLNEGLNSPNGSLASLGTSTNGVLTLKSNVTTPLGPVSAVIYGKGRSGIALAEYSGSSISAYNISASPPAEVYVETFHLDGPGPVPDRQDAPHPHEAVLDPTGAFLLVPDLGADLVRVWNVDAKTLALSPFVPLAAAPGSGPRHVAFLETDEKTFMYLISELGNTVTVYAVDYRCDGSLGFEQVFITNTHGDNGTLPAGVTAAEIALSPDNKFLLVTSRGETASANPGDPIITFGVDAKTGALAHVQTIGTGGLIPRQFSISRDGTLVAVGTQGDGKVNVFQRDVATGLLKGPVAGVPIAGGQVTCVVFDE